MFNTNLNKYERYTVRTNTILYNTGTMYIQYMHCGIEAWPIYVKFNSLKIKDLFVYNYLFPQSWVRHLCWETHVKKNRMTVLSYFLLFLFWVAPSNAPTFHLCKNEKYLEPSGITFCCCLNLSSFIVFLYS